MNDRDTDIGNKHNAHTTPHISEHVNTQNLHNTHIVYATRYMPVLSANAARSLQPPLSLAASRAGFRVAETEENSSPLYMRASGATDEQARAAGSGRQANTTRAAATAIDRGARPS